MNNQRRLQTIPFNFREHSAESHGVLRRSMLQTWAGKELHGRHRFDLNQEYVDKEASIG